MNENQDPAAAKRIVIYACSGCSDAGELADRAARALSQQKLGEMSCLAGIGGRVKPLLLKAEKADHLVAIDGCPLNCARHTLANAGFEIPSLGFGNYDDAPAGASWTFVPVWGGGQSGISANGSVFTDHNPNAPAGSQVGYIQGANTISQVINFPSCGTYRVRISAAQRDLFYNESTLGLDLYVDGAYHGSLTPADRNYVTLTSSQFYVSAGNHTITFQGVNNGYDNSVFIDSVQIISP